MQPIVSAQVEGSMTVTFHEPAGGPPLARDNIPVAEPLPPEPGEAGTLPTPLPPPAYNLAPPSPVEPEMAEGPEIRLGFWRLPVVQNFLPFMTSLVFHLVLILLGIATYQVVKKTVQVVQEQVIIPESTMADSGPPGGVVHPGAGVDPTRDAAQDVKETTDSSNWANKASNNLDQAALGGSEADSSMIAVGANTAIGGKGGLSGLGDNTGQLAPFGVPGGGGGAAPRSSFLGVGGNARKIVYVCQASGSMLSVFGDLKYKLKESIEALKPIQSFDVIFFADQNTFALDSTSLLAAGPDNKRKAYAFIDNIVEHGNTNPIQAINLALALKPELAYVLTDGFYGVSSFNDVVNAFRTGNPEKKTHVNCLYLESDEDPKLLQVLKQIALENGGQMKVIPKLGF